LSAPRQGSPIMLILAQRLPIDAQQVATDTPSIARTVAKLARSLRAYAGEYQEAMAAAEEVERLAHVPGKAAKLAKDRTFRRR
jgi:hypothetical protein